MSSQYRVEQSMMLYGIRQVFLVVAALLLVLALAACKGGPEPVPTGEIAGIKVEADGGYYYGITAPQLKAMLEREDVLLINAKAPYVGEIEGTDLFIPSQRMPYYARDLTENKDEKIVVYCRIGRSSTIAANALVYFGYTNVWNLKGGMEAWEKAGYELLHIEH